MNHCHIQLQHVDDVTVHRKRAVVRLPKFSTYPHNTRGTMTRGRAAREETTRRQSWYEKPNDCRALDFEGAPIESGFAQKGQRVNAAFVITSKMVEGGWMKAR